MTPELVMSLGRQAVEMTLILAGPLLLSALVVGLIDRRQVRTGCPWPGRRR